MITAVPADAAAGGAGPRLHVVLTCTKRKRRPPLPGLRLRDHARTGVEARLEGWIRALRGHGGEAAVPVSELYAGDHWQTGCSLRGTAAAQGIAATLWVCSAGYGLIPLESRVAPYSATFSRNHPDSVWRPGEGVSPGEAARRWWEALAEWEGPVPSAPRSIGALAAGAEGAAIWVVASPSYLAAMQADLAAAAGTLKSPDRLVLVSAGTKSLAGLDAHLLGFDWRLQGTAGLLGGAAMSLNVRVAKLLLEGGWEPRLEGLRARLELLSSAIPPRKPPVRKRVAAGQVEAFVRGELVRDPRLRAAPLLRKLRDELQWAYEEKRFRRLVSEVRQSLGDDAQDPV